MAFPREVMAWSQMLYVTEVLMALNTHGVEARGAFVTVDHALHQPGSTMMDDSALPLWLTGGPIPPFLADSLRHHSP